jgi:protein-S-isoprenylcysteine O-methyltransferase Ste14
MYSSHGAQRSSGSEDGASTAKVLRAVALLPGMVVVVVPGLLIWLYGTEIGWGIPGLLAALPVLASVALLSVALPLWLQTVRLFASVGKGTLAPWDPTQALVVQGPYGRVRNPMISAVAFILAGEAIALGSVAIGVWFAIFATVNAIYIPLGEEPGLARRFGEDYERYRQAVPRWIPRRTPWTPNRG